MERRFSACPSRAGGFDIVDSELGQTVAHREDREAAANYCRVANAVHDNGWKFLHEVDARCFHIEMNCGGSWTAQASARCSAPLDVAGGA